MATITSVEEYLSLVDDYKGLCFFRGQADKDWKLEPSLYRNDNFIAYEDKMLEELAVKHPKEFSALRNTYSQLLKAQHYGLPTRLLDITTNPLIALYFAVSDKSVNYTDGHVLIIKNINQDDDTSEKYKRMIALISTHPNFTHIDDIVSKMNSEEQDKKDFLLPEIFIGKTSFEDSNDRSFVQGAHSVVFGVKITKDNLVYKLEKISFPESLIECKLIIPHDLKERFLEQLDIIYGISEKTLLLSVENTTSAIKQMYVPVSKTYKYSVKLIDIFCMDICLDYKYSYPVIEQIVSEVDKQNHIMQYRVYINGDDLRYLNFICLARHSQKNLLLMILLHLNGIIPMILKEFINGMMKMRIKQWLR